MSDEPRPSRKLWILAAVAALGLHLGGAALALAHLRTDDDDDGLGAIGAEFAVEMASPKAPETDLPPGPDSEAMQEQQALPEQKAETKETELPKDQSQEVEDPDRVVTENNAKKPTEDEPKIQAIETPAAEASPKSVATARQTLDEDAREAEKALAPVIGIGKDILRITADWNRKISAHLSAHKVNPEGKVPSNQTAKVSFALNRRGNVISVDVIESSGDAAYDAAAISMVHKSDPFPIPPAGLTDDRFERTVEIMFKPPDEKKKKKSAQRQ
ncbi:MULTISPECIES: TonB family protein [unclassified Bradyrhizobium]|uniref:TonB family protein n=1 Tax=unclassified Bradyrhizobium TaxID=2631580 RepID=UPI0020B38682|nr:MULTISPECIES: TonB family protein [unclassified Bradyrhizobium]MCP3399214.1 TonB family protein [Bradyrhizobium sp. CCGB20]MCP3407852.1 TonB family protein [Bradyrhizobium sp. CCGB01]